MDRSQYQNNTAEALTLDVNQSEAVRPVSLTSLEVYQTTLTKPNGRFAVALENAIVTGGNISVTELTRPDFDIEDWPQTTAAWVQAANMTTPAGFTQMSTEMQTQTQMQMQPYECGGVADTSVGVVNVRAVSGGIRVAELQSAGYFNVGLREVTGTDALLSDLVGVSTLPHSCVRSCSYI